MDEEGKAGKYGWKDKSGEIMKEGPDRLTQ